eukprot:TRINITY_DN8143_c0_g1_i3.p1 TRINITY_DN8143_c0_g1~~TRINITY_DN8143_c0_g1_i3.p1  ORF type:complete len:666 (+),score=58.18 TRINITY_DN8143_c0_g1_i3:155-2152(+)
MWENFAYRCVDITVDITQTCAAGQVLVEIRENFSYRCVDITDTCPDGQFLIEIRENFSYRCADITRTCAAGQVLIEIRENFSYRCADVTNTCAAGQVLVEIRENFSYRCADITRACATGHVLVEIDNNFLYQCEDVTQACSAGEVLTEIDNNFVYQCEDITQACSAGEVLVEIDNSFIYHCVDVTVTCPSGHYLSGRTGVGSYQCTPLTFSCPAGEVVIGMTAGVPQCRSFCADTDGDLINDVCDNCPTTHNPSQQDSNGNGIGDICELSCTPTLTGGMALRSNLFPASSDFDLDGPVLEVSGGLVFLEASQIALVADRPFDSNAANDVGKTLSGAGDSPTGGMIPAGTVVDVWSVYVDPPSGSETVSGTLTFPVGCGCIAGLVYSTTCNTRPVPGGEAHLLVWNSEIGAVYGYNYGDFSATVCRGVEPYSAGSGDSISFDSSSQISFTLAAGTSDWLRVIMQAPSCPSVPPTYGSLATPFGTSVVSPGADLSKDGPAQTNTGVYFFEAEDLVVSGLNVDHLGSTPVTLEQTTYSSTATPGTITGTVNVHSVLIDPVDGSGSPRVISGSITFDASESVVALVFTAACLNTNGDLFHDEWATAIGLNYGAGQPPFLENDCRGVEPYGSANDIITIVDAQQVTYTLTSDDTKVDWLRIITQKNCACS